MDRSCFITRRPWATNMQPSGELPLSINIVAKIAAESWFSTFKFIIYFIELSKCLRNPTTSPFTSPSPSFKFFLTSLNVPKSCLKLRAESSFDAVEAEAFVNFLRSNPSPRLLLGFWNALWPIIKSRSHLEEKSKNCSNDVVNIKPLEWALCEWSKAICRTNFWKVCDFFNSIVC